MIKILFIKGGYYYSNGSFKSHFFEKYELPVDIFLDIKRKYKSFKDIEPIKDFYENIESYLSSLKIKYRNYYVDGKVIKVFLSDEEWDYYMKPFIRENKLKELLSSSR